MITSTTIAGELMVYYEKYSEHAINFQLQKGFAKLGKQLAKELTKQVMEKYEVRIYFVETPENPGKATIAMKLIPKGGEV